MKTMARELTDILNKSIQTRTGKENVFGWKEIYDLFYADLDAKNREEAIKNNLTQEIGL